MTIISQFRKIHSSDNANVGSPVFLTLEVLIYGSSPGNAPLRRLERNGIFYELAISKKSAIGHFCEEALQIHTSIPIYFVQDLTVRLQPHTVDPVYLS